MSEWFEYELWDGKNVVGHLRLVGRPMGKYISIPARSALKESYGRVNETIKCPLIFRTVYDRGPDIHCRLVVDVRRKSLRQIEFLKAHRWF